MRARIFQPSPNAMQSGQGDSNRWVLEFSPNSARSIDPLMGWTSSDDTQSQVRMKFDSKKAAMDYANSRGIDFTVRETNRRKPVIRPGGYGDNFATKRRSVWTH